MKTTNTIDFKPFLPEDKKFYEDLLFSQEERGCEFSFANLYLWGRQSFAEMNGTAVLPTCSQATQSRPSKAESVRTMRAPSRIQAGSCGERETVPRLSPSIAYSFPKI